MKLDGVMILEGYFPEDFHFFLWATVRKVSGNAHTDVETLNSGAMK